MTVRIWTGLLTTGFCIAIVAFAFVSRKPFCIDSTIVEKVDVLTSEGTERAYSCDVRKHLPYSKTVADLIPILQGKLRILESWLHFYSPQKIRASITVLDDQQLYFRVHGSEIFLSEEFLKKESFIERAVFKSIIRTTADASVLNDSLVEEVLIDLLYQVVTGKRALNETKVRWPGVLALESEYCKSDWKIGEHFQACSKGHFPGGHLVLRALLSFALSQSLEKLSPEELYRFSHSVLQDLPQIRMNEWIPGKTLESHAQQGYYESVVRVQNIVLSFQKSKGISAEAQRVFDELGIQLKILGFREEVESSFLDLVILKEVVSKGELEIFSKLAQDLPESSLAIQTPTEIYLLPSMTPLTRGTFGELRSHRSVWYRCGLPDWKEIESSMTSYHRVLVIDSCKQETVDLGPYLKQGVQNFALSNPDIGFISIHVPSFMHSLKRNENPFRWDLAEFDKSTRAFKSLNPIQSVDWFRGPHP
jgi:hypothetical protein